MLEAIKKRRSIRSYHPQPVEEAKVQEILKAGMVAPSANHRYPWQIVVITKEETRKKLAEATSWCSFIAEAPLCLVIIGEENKSREWIEDAAIMAENMVLEAVNQGLGSCFTQVRESKTPEGGDAENYVRQILGIPENLRVVFMLPIGYPAEELTPYGEETFKNEKVHFEKF